MKSKSASRRCLSTTIVLSLAAVICATCFADTFTQRVTGETFNGYIVKVYRGDKIQVRTDGGVKYVDLGNYYVQRNLLGRKKQVPVFSIKDPVELILQADAFEEAIAAAAKQGPLFILIEIDVVGSRVDLTRRIADAILATDTCSTYALLTGEKVGGAFGTAAVMALACDRIYMRQGTLIGALKTPALPERVSGGAEVALAAAPEEQSDSDWLSYVASVAKIRNRPEALLRAMFDENIEVVEASLEGKTFAADRSQVRAPMKIVGTVSEMGEPLTLGAQEAVCFGVADALVTSQAELLITLGASNARQIPNNVIARSRVAFDRDMRRIDRVLDVVAARKEREAEINTELKRVESMLDDYRRNSLYGVTPDLAAAADSVFQRRQALLIESVDLLSAQIADYQSLIQQTGRWADLADLTESLQQQLQTDAAKVNETRIKANLF